MRASNKSPKITVLIPVFNGSRYLGESIGSILNQTMDDFELLVIDDGSTDNSLSIINSMQDKRIRIIENGNNRGLVYTLNKGIQLARGEYIARMDCDDISLPRRLEKQYQYLVKNKNIGLVGTWVETIGDIEGDIFKYPTEPRELRSILLFDCQLAHPSIMLRKTLFERCNLHYALKSKYVEDWELWQRCSTCFDVSNIPEVLLQYRITKQSISRSHEEEQKENIKKIHKKNLSKLVNNLSDKELQLHCNIGAWKYSDNQTFILSSRKWLEKLYYSNQSKMLYPEPEFTHILSERWCSICNYGKKFSLKNWVNYERSFLAKLHGKRYRRSAGLLLKAVSLRN